MSQSTDKLTQTLQDILARVQEMPHGGNLEALIEEGIAEMNHELYASCLEARQQNTTSDPEDFPPSDLPGLRKDTAGE